MNDVVRVTREGPIGLIALNNPPVTAASQALRAGLLEGVRDLDADPAIQVIAIYAEGRTFIAGADITEFGKPPRDPSLPDVCNAIEASATPVVAVLHGTTLGGGLEVAMSAHARVALPGTRVGLPEINLGIFPGAGGTQRAPRLAGWETALDMILSGNPISAERAADAGLVDRMMEGDPGAVARAAAQSVIDGDLPTRRTRDITVDPAPELLQARLDKVRSKSPHLIAPQKAIEALAGATGDFDEGLRRERALFQECLQSDQSRALIHAFFAERAVQKIPEADATPRPIEHVAVIGGGTMGSGIGTAILMAGIPLTLLEMTDEAAGRARRTITGNLDGAVKRGKMTADKRDATLDRLTITTEMQDLAQADLVIEAVFEDMDVKRQVFGKLDGIAKPGAILASNTSYLDIDQIAAMTSRPQDVIGLHFFSPAHIMKLLEVVVGERTAPEVVATGFALARRLKKIAVRANVCPGFIGNRILSHYAKSVNYMVEDGASPQQVDDALTKFGLAMGPFMVSDLAGLDIGWANRKANAATRPAEERYTTFADRICERGMFGRKTGKGYYLYDGDTPRPNPEATEIIEAERQAAGVTRREYTDDEIVDRYMTAMILEAARVVEDGTALRPIDVDAVLLNGYGFPRFRGGPLHYADQLGAAEIVSRADRYAQEDPYYWQIPQILRDMAANGTTFADLNRKG
ncbi:3-hydroxyacyl-CoA dehydrogenase NAD-binding domain-containing protein [uncultured Paracoccus sp.]|uniref:3-hydroxyacyl-CoA dehydrogenase NAD-binding domain-containing protein n=1 Tax=uncultured Paracoccus sp. TaxID=189685 RepID=UPI002611591F|nr:3-hydroxyacyl-CoA dehydrogenase NAD-binding domain-containing protein [uncultured Paracoccus sp.]